MKKTFSFFLILALLVISAPVPAHAAGIAYVNAGSAKTGAPLAGSLTYAADATGGDMLYVGVMVNQNAGSATVSTVTYNGVAMTKAGSTVNGGAANTKVAQWYLSNPTTGSNNIVITLTASTELIIESGFVVLSGTNASPLGNTGSGNGTSAAPSTSVTTTAANSFILDTYGDNSECGTNTPTEDAPGTKRYSISEGVVAGQCTFGGTYPATTATSYSVSWTLGGSDTWGGVSMEVKAAATTATFNFWQFFAF